MSISRSIAPQLPYLRRFARALTGGQQSGDAYVAQLLEALVEDPSTFPKGVDARVGLYKAFLKLWNSMDLNRTPDRGGVETSVDKRLDSITPLPRQAFLLCSVEGFSIDEAGIILDMPRDQVRTLIDKAGQEIAAQVETDVLIIEDEPMIAMDLEGIVEGLGHTVIGQARTHTEAVRIIEESKPGLVLADIQLADGSSGLDAVNEILGSIEVPVIFITAYPERLLTGERPEPAFLITKPYQPDTVKAIISQALFFERRAHRSERSALRA